MKLTLKKIIYYILKFESELVLWKYKPKIVAITGSVGKTSTKDAVYAVLSEVAYVRKSEKSFNSEIGLPLSILGLHNGWNNPIIWLENIMDGLWLFLWPHKYPKWLVLEVGVGKPGDMKKTAAWLKTDAVIITAIGEMPAHIEFFSSRRHLVEEKSQLIKTLKKSGVLIINKDDETVGEMSAKGQNHIVSYGFNEGADILGSGYNISYDENGEPVGVVFRIDERGKSLPVVISGVFGKNHVYASLAALTLASALDLNMLDAIDSLNFYDVPPGRMRLLKGINGSLIIDDTYNSSPFACETALQTLGEVESKNGRKIAILGDMLELGKHTVEAHKKIGEFMSKIFLNTNGILITVGQRAKAIKEGAVERGMKEENIYEFGTAYEAKDFIDQFISKGDIILVKGSQGMRMERIISNILLDQENKNKLLVRQDAEWLKKSE